MNLREFLNLYDNWDGVICINDADLNLIIKDKPSFVLSSTGDLFIREVLAFDFYANELCVRVK